jgi:hypothetical protein
METTIHEPALKPETNSGAKSRGNAAPAPEPYASSIAHVLAELERIDLLIQIQIGRARQLQQQDEFQGLYISEQEVDSLLARPMGMPHWALAPSVATDENIHASLMELEAQIEGRTNSSIEQNIPLRLVALAKRFHLSPFDVDVVLMCLATELDVRYERLYAYLQDDVTRKRPSVDLALNLCAHRSQRNSPRAIVSIRPRLCSTVNWSRYLKIRRFLKLRFSTDLSSWMIASSITFSEEMRSTRAWPARFLCLSLDFRSGN